MIFFIKKKKKINDSFAWTEQKLKRNLNSLSFGNLLVMEVLLLDNYRSRSRKRNFFSAPAPQH